MKQRRTIVERVLCLYGCLRNSFGILSSIAVILMVLSIVPDALGRKFINKPIPGVLELNELLMIVAVFLALALTQFRGNHIRVEFLVSRFSPETQNVISLGGLVLSLAYFIFITWTGISEAYLSVVKHEVKWGLILFPTSPSRIMLALGSLLLCIEFLITIINRFMRTFRKASLVNPEKKAV